MDRECLENGLAQYGTPLYVFQLDELRENVSRIRRGLEGKAGICFAMKADPFLVSPLEPQVERIEVCSMGEFQICRKRRIPPEKILVSGVLKKKEDIYAILNQCRGRCAYTAESINQFLCYVDWCEANCEVLRVYLRLTSGNQFGMDLETVKSILERRNVCPFLKIQGIHYFSGTQKKTAEKMKKELAYLDLVLQALEEKAKFPIEELEYGPGIAVPYFEGQEDTLESDVKALAQAVASMTWKGTVTLEMGRALAAGCGYYLTSVCDVKQNNGKNYCIVDGGLHQMNYDGQIRGMYRPRFQVSPGRAAGRQKQWTVCGALCTGNDILMQNVPITDLGTGDVLIFEGAGAYSMTEGMALFLSHALPKAAFYSREEGWRLIREEQPTYVHNMERES